MDRICRRHSLRFAPRCADFCDLLAQDLRLLSAMDYGRFGRSYGLSHRAKCHRAAPHLQQLAVRQKLA